MKRSRPLEFGILVTAILGAGCSNPGHLYPLKVGNTWSYQVRNSMAEFLNTVTVVRSVPVAGTSGFELSSSMGESRMAWKGSILYASVLPGMRFNPPIPILDGGRKKSDLIWRGSVFAFGRTTQYTADLAQEPSEFKQAGRSVKSIRTILKLKTTNREIEVITHYAGGIGPINQVQRTTTGEMERFDLNLEHLSGP